MIATRSTASATGPSATPLLVLGSGLPLLAAVEEFRAVIADERDALVLDPPAPTAPGTGYLSDAARSVIAAVRGRWPDGASIDVVGGGLGAAIALRVALDQPDLFRRMVLVAPAGAGASTMAPPAVELPDLLDLVAGPRGQLLDGLRHAIGPRAAELVSASATIDGAAAAAIAAELREGPSELPPLLRSLSAPTLLLWGHHDRLEPLDRAFFVLRRMPNAHLRAFSGCGHAVALERSFAVARLTRRHREVGAER